MSHVKFPSCLPTQNISDGSLSLKGPAPLHHTLLNRLERTGVTLQTLHPKHFDRGNIVDQTSQPGLPIPDLQNATIESLLGFLGPLGAEMLQTSIRDGTFTETRHVTGKGEHSRHAPKITPSDRRIDWDRWDAEETVLRDRVLGRLWDERIHQDDSSSSESKPFRTIYHGFTKYNGDHNEVLHNLRNGDAEATTTDIAGLGNGSTIRLHKPPKPDQTLLRCHDGSFVIPLEVTPEGERRMRAHEFYDSREPGVCI